MRLIMIPRFLTGVAEGALIPITYSFIPDLYPDDFMVKFGNLEIWGSIGTIMGAPLSSLIFAQLLFSLLCRVLTECFLSYFFY